MIRAQTDESIEHLTRTSLDPLTRAEEARLIPLAQAGDEDARERIIRANVRFVIDTVKPLRFRGVEFSDLIQEGLFGLLHALDRFDVSTGYKFITYAVWWIRQAALLAVNTAPAVRIPVSIIDLRNKFSHRAHHLGLDHVLDFEAIADTMELTQIQREGVRTALTTEQSLDADWKVNDEAKPKSLADRYLVDHGVPREIYDRLSAEEFRNAVEETLSGFPKRDRLIFVRYWGLDGGEPETLGVIGKGLGLTRERVRQIKAQVEEKLRTSPVLAALVRSNAFGLN